MERRSPEAVRSPGPRGPSVAGPPASGPGAAPRRPTRNRPQRLPAPARMPISTATNGEIGGLEHGPPWDHPVAFLGTLNAHEHVARWEREHGNERGDERRAGRARNGTLSRFRLLAAMTALFRDDVRNPLTFDSTRWYAGKRLIAWPLLAALAGYACYVPLGAPAAPRPSARRRPDRSASRSDPERDCPSPLRRAPQEHPPEEGRSSPPSGE